MPSKSVDRNPQNEDEEQQCEVSLSDRYVGPPYSRTKIYADRVSYDATDDWHRPPLHGFAAAVRAAPGTDRRTDRRTRESRDTTVLTLNKLTTAYVMKRYSTHRRSTSFRRCCRDSRPVCHRRMNTKCSRSWRTEISRFHTQLYTHTLAYTLLTVTTASLLQKLYCSDNNIN